MLAVDNVFKVFKQPQFIAFKEFSTAKLYCIICFKQPGLRKNSYVLKSKQFFDKHLVAISKSDDFIRASKAKDIKLISYNSKRAEIIVLFTIYQKDELAPGHEGAQFGMHFRKIGDFYKFSGIETIP